LNSFAAGDALPPHPNPYPPLQPAPAPDSSFSSAHLSEYIADKPPNFRDYEQESGAGAGLE
jgi:hypothetical protein